MFFLLFVFNLLRFRQFILSSESFEFSAQNVFWELKSFFFYAD